MFEPKRCLYLFYQLRILLLHETLLLHLLLLYHRHAVHVQFTLLLNIGLQLFHQILLSKSKLLDGSLIEVIVLLFKVMMVLVHRPWLKLLLGEIHLAKMHLRWPPIGLTPVSSISTSSSTLLVRLNVKR